MMAASIHWHMIVVATLLHSEKNYSSTELETLAVVPMGCYTFPLLCTYLYGNKVAVFTDHAAFKSVLGAPNLNGKYTY